MVLQFKVEKYFLLYYAKEKLYDTKQTDFNESKLKYEANFVPTKFFNIYRLLHATLFKTLIKNILNFCYTKSS